MTRLRARDHRPTVSIDVCHEIVLRDALVEDRKIMVYVKQDIEATRGKSVYRWPVGVINTWFPEQRS